MRGNHDNNQRIAMCFKISGGTLVLHETSLQDGGFSVFNTHSVVHRLATSPRAC